jgi:hypothetical protein
MPDGDKKDVAKDPAGHGLGEKNRGMHEARTGYGIGRAFTSSIMAISEGGVRSFLIISAIGATLFFVVAAQANGEQYLIEINPNVMGYLGSVAIYEGAVWIAGLGIVIMAIVTAINRLLGIFGVLFGIFLLVVA